MKIARKAFPLKDLLVMTSTGTIDLAASRAALRILAADPEYKSNYELLLDLRDVECTLSLSDVFEIATYMTQLDPALPPRRKIALLVSGRIAFDHAQFLELCSRNRGRQIGAFEDYKKAGEWLDVDLPADPKAADSTPPP
jgi:hypothetical protein